MKATSAVGAAWPGPQAASRSVTTRILSANGVFMGPPRIMEIRGCRLGSRAGRDGCRSVLALSYNDDIDEALGAKAHALVIHHLPVADVFAGAFRGHQVSDESDPRIGLNEITLGADDNTVGRGAHLVAVQEAEGVVL